MGLFDSIPSHMDYVGQKFAEQVFQAIIVSFAIVGFVVGYTFQQLSYSMYILGAGCVVAGLVTLPPWPMYRKNPINWQKPESDTAGAAKSKPSKKKN